MFEFISKFDYLRRNNELAVRLIRVREVVALVVLFRGEERFQRREFRDDRCIPNIAGIQFSD